MYFNDMYITAIHEVGFCTFGPIFQPNRLVLQSNLQTRPAILGLVKDDRG